MQEQQVNEEFDAARARYLARREAGAIRYVSHEEAGRRLGLPSRVFYTIDEERRAVQIDHVARLP